MKYFKCQGVGASLRPRVMKRAGRPLEWFAPRLLALSPRRFVQGLGLWLDQGGAAGCCDVLVVLGGGSVSRSFYATELYRRFDPALVILFSNAKPRDLAAAGAQSSRSILKLAGIPDEKVLHDDSVETTFDEANYLRGRVAGQRLLIVTDWYHRRRVRLVLDRALRHTETTINVCSAPEAQKLFWWHSGERSLDVLSECAALLYYAFRGRI